MLFTSIAQWFQSFLILVHSSELYRFCRPSVLILTDGSYEFSEIHKNSVADRLLVCTISPDSSIEVNGYNKQQVRCEKKNMFNLKLSSERGFPPSLLIVSRATLHSTWWRPNAGLSTDIKH